MSLRKEVAMPGPMAVANGGGKPSFRRQAAWYRKRHPTLADALAVVRKELWAHETFHGSPAHRDTIKVPRAFVERLAGEVCYAA